jgi:hypothetical protein
VTNRRNAWIAAALAALLVLAAPAAAHETDQFTVPVGREFVDLGRFVSYASYTAIKKGMDKTNARIARAVRSHDRAEVDALTSPDEIASAVHAAYGPAYNQIEDLETVIRNKKLQDRFPGRILGFTPPRWIYHDTHFVLDPRKINMSLWRASTIEVYGTYLGTDKLGHFHDMGYIYYTNYRSALRRGATEDEALRRGVDVGIYGVLSERGILGEVSSGMYSNGDLAANYVGMKFYQNLTRPVMLKGKEHPPLLVADGPYWSMNPDVFRDVDFFRAYVSDHFDEALNPCLYFGGIREGIVRAVKERAESLRAWYADADGRERPREFFDNLARGLSTYYGEDYGHRGDDSTLVTIGNTCFEPEAEARTAGTP